MQRGSMPGPTLCAALIALALGCGGGSEFPETTPVSGKISFKGEPVTKGTITFQPDQGQVATGMIQPDGTYTLSTFAEKDGAIPGHHKVMIIANDGDSSMIPGSSPGYKKPKDLIPKKYASLDTSGLEAQVSKDKPTVDFDLK